MTGRRAAALLIGLTIAVPVWAQGTVTDVDMSIGTSTAPTDEAATEVRVLTNLSPTWRALGNLTWGALTETGSDAFSAAYAYDNRVRPDEAYVERVAPPGASLVDVRLGRYRTPFGISSPSDYAYTGFTRAPLIRYGENYTLANTFLEAGADVVVGKPSLQFETSVGAPLDEGASPRPEAVDLTSRVQAFYRSLIVGVSWLDTAPSMPGPFVSGRMRFGGVDARWMRSGVQLRGEWIDGRPFDGVSTRGGYVDLLVHRLEMGPVTVVARAERLDYAAGLFSAYNRRVTIGARVRLTQRISFEADGLDDFGPTPHPRGVNVDASVTESLRF